jgi:hypothetical protein
MMRSGQEQTGEPRKDDPEKTRAQKKKSVSSVNAEPRSIDDPIRIEGLSLTTPHRPLVGPSSVANRICALTRQVCESKKLVRLYFRWPRLVDDLSA